MTDGWLTAEQQVAWRSYLLGSILLGERLDRDLRNKHDLSLPEYEILVRLSESPQRELRMAELAHSLRHSRSRLTHTVNRLEQAGYVVRRACSSDGRGVMATLTDLGLATLVKAAPDHVASVRDHLVDVLTADEFRVVGEAFARVGARLDKPAPSGVRCDDSPG
jgi:DNA-binding MarR family transcriptional regulator